MRYTRLMTEFSRRYQNLNPKQREAVDSIDGPVMVVAGPGTGKTELLSVRVANILQKTDALPSDILCLTFTDSGAAAMRERLSNLLGADAYKVAVHTFHSFGSDIINHNSEYFYSGARFRPANELNSYEILTEIMEKLPNSNPLASTMNGEFTYMRDIQTSISELKRGGLTPDELDLILDRNDAFISWVQPKLDEVFCERLSKKSLGRIAVLAKEISSYSDEPLELIGYIPLYQLIASSLQTACEFAEADNSSTKPISAWKKLYLEKNPQGKQTLKDEKRSKRLHALSKIYDSYLIAMQERELYDYDDMILRVVHAIEIFPELRYNLQETYQYILVDEFQDTNDAQMRLVWNLTNNPSSEGRPNIMVVGDDDQAIYRFQGAELSNIIDFRSRYRDVAVVTLTDNYRSSADILQLARKVIVQGSERLENTVAGIDKTLTPHHTAKRPLLVARTYETSCQSNFALAHSIANDCAKQPDESRAVIARNHRHLVALVPYLEHAGVPIRYERNENVLDTEPIKQLELVARVVHSLRHDLFEEADESIAQLIAHPAWKIPARDIWQLSLDSKNQHKTWLEIMLTNHSGERLEQIGEWLVVAAQSSKNQPLEYMLDYLFGTETDQLPDSTQAESEPFGDKVATGDFVSPLYQYFFNQQGFEQTPARYLAHLLALRAIRSRLREYRPDAQLELCDLVSFVEMHHDLGLAIQARSELETGQNPVVLLTAHKAKGLEYDTVYITDAQESIWGSSARSRSRMLQFTSNLPLSPAGDSTDERLRLFYVALTRAKDQLVIVSAREAENGKSLAPIGALAGLIEPTSEPALDTHDAITAAQTDWRTPLFEISTGDQQRLLRPTLERYKLSPTHLTNYLDVAGAGPEMFLLNNLLRFPQAMSPSAAFGSAIHSVLQRAHQHLAATEKRKPIEDILKDFEQTLGDFQLAKLDRNKYTDRGYAVLNTFFEQRYDSFTISQLVERNFANANVHVGDAILTGVIDLLDIDRDEKTVFVTDYKTGKAVNSWKGKSEYEKIKMHHYEQQLMFYKLLIENSGQFTGYTVTGGRIEFVEPDERGEILLLDYDYSDDKIAEFSQLVSAVWNRIQNLDFTLETEYPSSISGIIDFENSLLDQSH